MNKKKTQTIGKCVFAVIGYIVAKEVANDIGDNVIFEMGNDKGVYLKVKVKPKTKKKVKL